MNKTYNIKYTYKGNIISFPFNLGFVSVWWFSSNPIAFSCY